MLILLVIFFQACNLVHTNHPGNFPFSFYVPSEPINVKTQNCLALINNFSDMIIDLKVRYLIPKQKFDVIALPKCEKKF